MNLKKSSAERNEAAAVPLKLFLKKKRKKAVPKKKKKKGGGERKKENKLFCIGSIVMFNQTGKLTSMYDLRAKIVRKQISVKRKRKKGAESYLN